MACRAITMMDVLDEGAARRPAGLDSAGHRSDQGGAATARRRGRVTFMQVIVSALVAVLLVLAGTIVDDAAAQAPVKIKYALGDVVSIDELPLLIAAERAKARGVEVEIVAFKSEEIATQAVVNGQADIGQGTPYAVVEKITPPIRFFYQLSTLQFFPIVNTEHYKSWKDLNDQEIAVHARGSGTEAIMNLAAKQHGIKYKSVSYVPGSQVRALALLKGTIKASILDAANKSYVMKEAPGRFAVLPLGETKASDEALFATTAFLEKHREAVGVLRVARQINAKPSTVMDERKRLGLLKDLPAKMEPEIMPFYEEAVAGGVFPNDGGGERAAMNDLEFYRLSGQIKDAAPKVVSFWDLVPLKAALAKVGN
jgi:NitT/TauT family transport system substrate-binding protein